MLITLLLMALAEPTRQLQVFPGGLSGNLGPHSCLFSSSLHDEEVLQSISKQGPVCGLLRVQGDQN